MKQKLIVKDNAETFNTEVNNLLAKEWYYVPGTFIANMSADGKTERFTMLLVQDEDHDDIVNAVKQQMALDGCTCQGEAHHGAFPPPFFKPFEEPPSTPECNPGLS